MGQLEAGVLVMARAFAAAAPPTSINSCSKQVAGELFLEERTQGQAAKDGELYFLF